MIEIKNLCKDYGNLRVLDSINFKINKGEFITIFGPNGCGKSTLLNLLTNLEEFKGEINCEKNLKYAAVFQNFSESLLPWKTVIGNVKLNSNQHKKALDMLKRLNLSDYKDVYPYQLSGGMQQKVAIARAFVSDPDIILLDEPFSALDHSTSKNLVFELMNLWNENKVTTIFVSHNIDEAILLADKILVLSNKPTKIKAKIKVNLPRPRKPEDIKNKEFLRIKKKILKLI